MVKGGIIEYLRKVNVIDGDVGNLKILGVFSGIFLGIRYNGYCVYDEDSFFLF